MRLGAKIKASREKIGLSQLSLSRSCLVSRAHIAKIESEGYLPSISILVKIFAILNMEKEYKAINLILKG